MNYEQLAQRWRVLLLVVGGMLVTCHLSLVTPSPVEAGELKIGYVNIGKIFDRYERTKTSNTALEKKGKQKEAELEGRMDELKKLRQSLELLNDEVREAKSREIEEKAEELQRFRAHSARELRRERDKMAKEILTEIGQTLEEYAKTNQFSLLIDSRSVLYGQAAHDVTDDVLNLLNTRSKATPAGAKNP